MNNFDFYSPTKIVFGRGRENDVGGLVRPHAKKVLLHYGGGSINKSGLYGRVTASLVAAGVDFIELSGVVPNPRLSLVNEGIALCRRENIGFILAVGGGSVIDSAKAIAMGVLYDGDVWDFYNGSTAEKALPVGVVLTIPAAGSESSDASVITNEETKKKKGAHSDLIRPVFAVMNPELFFTLPKNQIANGVADMMSHIFERYFTNTENVEITDAMCEGILRTIIKFAPRVVSNPGDYDAWCQVGLAGTFAHTNILGLGRDQDWGCHAMEHELSALFDVAHGAGLAVLTPVWMRYVYETNKRMFLKFAVNVMGASAAGRTDTEVIDGAIDSLAEFFKVVGLPSTLRELGITRESLEEMANRVTGGGKTTIGGFRKLNYGDVLAIYKAAY